MTSPGCIRWGRALHATALAEELGIATVVCPLIRERSRLWASLAADLRRDYVRTVYATAATAEPSRSRGGFPRHGSRRQ